MRISDFDLGWLVGILEGEGYFEYNGCSQKVTVRMTDLDSMQTVARLMRVIVEAEVELTSYMPSNPKAQEIFQAYVTGERARRLMRVVVPYMSERRRARIWQALNKYKAPKPQTLKELGIDISQLVKG